MRTIYKYTLDLAVPITIKAPRIHRWLCAEVQYGEPTVWCEVETDSDEREYVLHVRGTGHLMTGEEGRHIGTFMLHGGALVVHLFETKRGWAASTTTG